MIREERALFVCSSTDHRSLLLVAFGFFVFRFSAGEPVVPIETVSDVLGIVCPQHRDKRIGGSRSLRPRFVRFRSDHLRDDRCQQHGRWKPDGTRGLVRGVRDRHRSRLVRRSGTIDSDFFQQRSDVDTVVYEEIASGETGEGQGNRGRQVRDAVLLQERFRRFSVPLLGGLRETGFQSVFLRGCFRRIRVFRRGFESRRVPPCSGRGTGTRGRPEPSGCLEGMRRVEHNEAADNYHQNKALVYHYSHLKYCVFFFLETVVCLLVASVLRWMYRTVPSYSIALYYM
mmetsp:Transcript_24967/g.53186  ORF Transcript_24967/g.53186 Transcript_24967/m.53186 type:complete len:286 (+) Transcript_24967:137-994(+)